MTKRQLLLSVVIVIVWFSLFSVEAVSGGNNSDEPGESISQASGVLCPKLFQEYWRCCQSWIREVPLDDNGPKWGSAGPWVRHRDTYDDDLPGDGEILAHTNFVLGGEAYFHEHLWRDNQGTSEGWIRCIGPGKPGNWEGPYGLTGLPGTGEIQTLDCFVLGNYIHQSYWRNNVGYYRTIPIIDDEPDWGAASGWTVMQINEIGLPSWSTGDIQSHGSFVWKDVLYQGIWRGDDGFARKVPISGDVVLWDDASDWSDPPITLYEYPGCGSMQAQHDYVGHKTPPWWK